MIDLFRLFHLTWPEGRSSTASSFPWIVIVQSVQSPEPLGNTGVFIPAGDGGEGGGGDVSPLLG